MRRREKSSGRVRARERHCRFEPLEPRVLLAWWSPGAPPVQLPGGGQNQWL